MPPLDWQLIAVLVCLAIAALSIARRAWRLCRPKTGTLATGACGSCGSCESGAAAATGVGAAFVPLDVLRSAAEERPPQDSRCTTDGAGP